MIDIFFPPLTKCYSVSPYGCGKCYITLRMAIHSILSTIGKNFGYSSAIFQNHRIRGLLEKCALDHEARMENLQNELRARALYDAKWRQIQQDLSHSVSMTACHQKAIDY